MVNWVSPQAWSRKPGSPILPSSNNDADLEITLDTAVMPQNIYPSFNETENIHQLVSKGASVGLDIVARLFAGLFIADGDWTCYRRNYFSVACGFILKTEDSSQVFLRRPDGSPNQEIVDFAVSTAAVVDGVDGKPIGLIQHTPEMSTGPQNPPSRIIVKSLKGGLPEQSQKLEIFERIQFKNATANNGKRRACQQYYFILVEVWANVGSNSEDWVRITLCKSVPVVVRGRSPGHYQAERRNLQISSLEPRAASLDSGNDSGSHPETFPNREPEISEVDSIPADDNSSVSSVSDLFTGTDLSTAPSSTAGPVNTDNLFVDLLLEDEGMKNLCIDGFTNIDPDRFERNLRRLLKHYSAALIADPDSIRRAQVMKTYLAEQSEGNQVVQQYSRQRQEIDIQDIDIQEDDSEDQNDLDQLDPPTLHLEHLKTFMTNSNAFKDLREGLMGFVIPIQIASLNCAITQEHIKARLNELESSDHTSSFIMTS
ncbi:hypothetical protein G7Y89_g6357 [Cudoniella acicularis]|uniref:NDT80 domain-containing protein n=1 Tax=Cudoniella acicularis TaxID=354080 RepID=A0A8H4RKP1_9HELO|nr:hypothetical protein G7Y89_g6357 [Cudoniella acicularis]